MIETPDGWIRINISLTVCDKVKEVMAKQK